jgi:hypothetical protein
VVSHKKANRLWVFENGVLKNVLGTGKEEETGD